MKVKVVSLRIPPELLYARRPEPVLSVLAPPIAEPPPEHIARSERNILADRLRSLADAMTGEIETKQRPMSQRFTPKRNSQYMSRLWEADNLERTQQALLALADAHERGCVPALLAHLRTKKDIAPLVYKGLLGGGYYEVIRDPEYQDQSAEAKCLRELVEDFTNDEAKQRQRDREALQQLERMTNEVRGWDITGFFPTPKKLAKRVVDLADIHRDMTVLEPSAGIGSIADEVRAAGVEPHCVEIHHKLQDILRAKQFSLLAVDDFLAMDVTFRYDRIVMNPPFENGQDAEHVRHAYDLLKPGGRLVAIMSTGPTFREDRKSIAFRAWLLGLGDKAFYEQLPENSFNGPEAFRPTAVATILLCADK